MLCKILTENSNKLFLVQFFTAKLNCMLLVFKNIKAINLLRKYFAIKVQSKCRFGCTCQRHQIEALHKEVSGDVAYLLPPADKLRVKMYRRS